MELLFWILWKHTLRCVQTNISEHVKVRPHLHMNTNEAGRDEAYANISLDCNTRKNVVIRRANQWFSLKYRLQADSVRSASDQTEAVFLSSVTRLHCYTCLASAFLGHIFVLMSRLNVMFVCLDKMRIAALNGCSPNFPRTVNKCPVISQLIEKSLFYLEHT